MTNVETTAPLTFDDRIPGRVYLGETLVSSRWGAAFLGLTMFVAVFLNRRQNLSSAIVVIVFSSAFGAAISSWIWIGGWVDFWSGRLTLPGHFARFLCATVVGAMIGWTYESVQGRPAGARLFAVVGGSTLGSIVAVWQVWSWFRLDDVPGLVDQGVQLSGQRPRLAAPCFTSAIRRDPGYARAYFERATLLLETSFLDQDIRRAFTEPGRVTFELREDVAFDDLSRAISTQPGYAAAHLKRGSLLSWMARRDQPRDRVIELREMAVADLTHAVRIDPGNAQAYFQRGLIWPSGDERELDDFYEAIRLDPESADYREKRARAYQERGDHDRAITDLTEAIRLAPKCFWFYQQRADSYRAKGDYGRSEDDLTQYRKKRTEPM